MKDAGSRQGINTSYQVPLKSSQPPAVNDNCVLCSQTATDNTKPSPGCFPGARSLDKGSLAEPLSQPAVMETLFARWLFYFVPISCSRSNTPSYQCNLYFYTQPNTLPSSVFPSGSKASQCNEASCANVHQGRIKADLQHPRKRQKKPE